MAGAAPILAIIGPTASGKSDLAVAVAETCRAEVLSVDSMQVYRGLDIGTAKPSPAERARVRHHLIDVVEPSQSFTAARFVELADAAIADAAARSVPLVAVGGTPLYFKVLFHGMFEGPGADAELRARLRATPGEALHARLAEVDPAAAARIHSNDTKRLVRALEVFELTGKPISQFQTAWSEPASRHRVAWVGLRWEKDELNRRINARVKAMMSAGWLDEARRLVERHVTLSDTASEATGYQELLAHLHGEIPLDEAVERIKIATRQLARRQVKWFRRFPDVLWLDGTAPLERNREAALTVWQSQLKSA
jgi:tRNA dimethylallyltransferase